MEKHILTISLDDDIYQKIKDLDKKKSEIINEGMKYYLFGADSIKFKINSCLNKVKYYEKDLKTYLRLKEEKFKNISDKIKQDLVIEKKIIDDTPQFLKIRIRLFNKKYNLNWIEEDYLKMIKKWG